MAADKNTRTLNVKTPGELPAVERDADTEELDLGADETAAAISEEDARIEAEVQRRLAMRTGRKPGDHPHQSEIDATKIQRAVMSTDGYVCPAPPPMDEAVAAMRQIMAR